MTQEATTAPNLAARCLAEVIGTFVLVFFGCGVVHAAVLTEAQSGLWQVAIVWGMAVTAAILVVGNISGAHLNPAITVALAVWRRCAWTDVGPYVVSQVVGAIVAASCLNVIFSQQLLDRERALGIRRGEAGSEMTAMCYGEFYPNPGRIAGPWEKQLATWKHDGTASLTETQVAELRTLAAEERSKVSEPTAFLAEFVGTLILALVVFSVTDPRNSAGPLTPVIIGLTVAMLISVIAPLTQACFNPARDFGPRLVTYFAGWGEAALPGPNGRGFFTVYILSPVLGAVAGGAVHRFCLSQAYRKSLAILMTIACLGLPAQAQELALRLDPDLPYQAVKSQPVTYQVEFAAVVTPPYKAKVLKIWLPIPPSDAAQEVSGSKLSTFPMDVQPKMTTEPLYGNQFAYFEFKQPQGAQLVRHQFTIKTWELNWNVRPADVAKVSRWPDGFKKFLRSEPLTPVDDRVASLARTIVPAPANSAQDLSAVMQWIQKTMKYSHEECSLQGSALFALEKKVGHCSDYHGLCNALGRSLGYPTRIVYGINPYPKNSPSHCKFEAYLPPYGWVCFDVSETQQMMAKIKLDDKLSDDQKEALANAALKRMNEGFRDNTWFLQTRGSDYDLAPPASRKVAVVRTIFAEADGVPFPEPDPANPKQTAFSWMTMHRYLPDRTVTNPFQDWRSLERFK